MSKPSLLIATPAFGGLFTQQYVESILSTWDWIGQEGIRVATYFIQNESLITRARNTCASLALHLGINKILFIDADIGWTPQDLSLLYYSEKKIVGGLYPHKSYPIVLNYNALPGAVAEESGEIEVRNVATGFLSIDCSVLRELTKTVPKYQSSHMNGEMRDYWDFFPVGTSRGEYESEDWAFCRMAREAGFSCHANLRIRLTHTGTHTWRPE